ncbi:MAG: sigma-70 family RNA polymerase sigma factor [Planctomycetota bacterium]
MDFTDSTRVSLVARLRDHDDAQAWAEFVDIYGPLIYRFGRRRGLQDADGADLAQDVLREVARSIVQFNYDPEIGRFRNWLFLITRRVLGRRLRTMERSTRGSGDTRVLKKLNELPEREGEDLWEAEYRRHLFQWASDQIRQEFAESTWSAFWSTAVDGEKPSEVAASLQMSIGSVYVAKNRVLKRLKERIERVDETMRYE